MGERLETDSRYTVFHPSDIELDETTKTILRAIEQKKPSRVVFDSLSEMRMMAADPLKFRRQILALKHYFIRCSCTVLMLDDRTSDGPDRQLESIAHGVISLDYTPADYGHQRHTLRVVKMRGVAFQSGDHDFSIQTGGLVVFPALDDGASYGRKRGRHLGCRCAKPRQSARAAALLWYQLTIASARPA